MQVREVLVLCIRWCQSRWTSGRISRIPMGASPPTSWKPSTRTRSVMRTPSRTMCLSPGSCRCALSRLEGNTHRASEVSPYVKLQLYLGDLHSAWTVPCHVSKAPVDSCGVLLSVSQVERFSSGTAPSVLLLSAGASMTTQSCTLTARTCLILLSKCERLMLGVFGTWHEAYMFSIIHGTWTLRIDRDWNSGTGLYLFLLLRFSRLKAS